MAEEYEVIFPLQFTDGKIAPEVKRGNMMACILLTEREGKHASFAAYYLNAYPLEHEDCICPDDSDHDGDGCPTTGWFYDQSNFEYDNCYYSVAGTVLAWAPIPKSKELLAAITQPGAQP